MNVSVVDISSLALTPKDVIVRLLCAMLIGIIIGTEREYTHRPAGMRTHMLVAIGACAVMITSQMIFCQYYAFGAMPDPARLSAQVIAGVGFLGAGTILREGTTIKGLTTAASVWTVACLGIAVGGGYYAVGFMGAACMFVTLTLFEWIQKKLMRSRDATYSFCISCIDVVQMLEQVSDIATKSDSRVISIHVDPDKNSDSERVSLSFTADFSGRHANERMQKFFAELNNSPWAHSVHMEKSRI